MVGGAGLAHWAGRAGRSRRGSGWDARSVFWGARSWVGAKGGCVVLRRYGAVDLMSARVLVLLSGGPLEQGYQGAGDLDLAPSLDMDRAVAGWRSGATGGRAGAPGGVMAGGIGGAPTGAKTGEMAEAMGATKDGTPTGAMIGEKLYDGREHRPDGWPEG